MEADIDKQQRVAVMLERLASATSNPLSPSDLMISSTRPAAIEDAPDTASTIALARINRLPLLHWMIAAINSVLAGEEPAQPRPVGTMLECGRFVAQGIELWAHDWYGHGRRCLLVHCRNVNAAEELAARLNTLLRP